MIASDQDVFDHYIHMRIRPWTKEDWDGQGNNPTARTLQSLFSVLPESTTYSSPICEYLKSRGIPCGESTTHVVVMQIDGGEESRVFYCLAHARQLKEKLIGP